MESIFTSKRQEYSLRGGMRIYGSQSLFACRWNVRFGAVAELRPSHTPRPQVFHAAGDLRLETYGRRFRRSSETAPSEGKAGVGGRILYDFDDRSRWSQR